MFSINGLFVTRKIEVYPIYEFGRTNEWVLFVFCIVYIANRNQQIESCGTADESEDLSLIDRIKMKVCLFTSSKGKVNDQCSSTLQCRCFSSPFVI